MFPVSRVIFKENHTLTRLTSMTCRTLCYEKKNHCTRTFQQVRIFIHLVNDLFDRSPKHIQSCFFFLYSQKHKVLKYCSQRRMSSLSDRWLCVELTNASFLLSFVQKHCFKSQLSSFLTPFPVDHFPLLHFRTQPAKYTDWNSSKPFRWRKQSKYINSDVPIWTLNVIIMEIVFCKKQPGCY